MNKEKKTNKKKGPDEVKIAAYPDQLKKAELEINATMNSRDALEGIEVSMLSED